MGYNTTIIKMKGVPNEGGMVNEMEIELTYNNFEDEVLQSDSSFSPVIWHSSTPWMFTLTLGSL